jgi:urea carboxylase-associated protein 1
MSRNADPPAGELEVVVEAGGRWSGIVPAGHVLRIEDLEGNQGVDFLCYNAADPEERYHAPNTLKKARTLLLTTGHVLYSDIARPLMTIVGDSFGFHDTIGGCCSEPSNRMLYGVQGQPGCRENFLAALEAFGLGRRDIVPNLNFFCRVPVGPDSRLADKVFEPGGSKPGDYIALRAEMDVIVAVSNCPQVNNPAAGGRPTPIRMVVGA